jgi:hypothetical protein
LPGLYPQLTGQGELGILAGISNYQGDLSSYSTQNGLKVLVGPVFGLHGGYNLTEHFQFRTDLLYTRLSGDDELNEKAETRLRNLDFFTPVIQLAFGLDWNIFGFGSGDQKSFTPYASIGGSIFYFNPKTEYLGDVVALHPLGTEGQYLDDYPDQKPYSLFQPSLQFGGGLKFLTSDKLILALEGMMTLSFTDYLDDVSTIYISYPELLEKAGTLTAALANRQGEFLGTEPVIVPTGTARANSESNDFFGMITLRASIPVKMESSRFKVRRHNNKRINCPKF